MMRNYVNIEKNTKIQKQKKKTKKYLSKAQKIKKVIIYRGNEVGFNTGYFLCIYPHKTSKNKFVKK